MPAGTTILVYQAYGHEAILEECLWSLLSLSRWIQPEEAPDVWIYTDQPEWFQAWPIPFSVVYQKLDAEKIKAWRGPQNFVHRLKIELLADVLKQRPGPLLYLDTDTEFVQSPLPLLRSVAAGKRFMHVSEGKLSQPQQPVLNKLLSFFQKHPNLPGCKLEVTGDTEMWNAGVLGFSEKEECPLHQALLLTDALYPLYPKHIVEQFSFSVVMQEKGVVHAAAPYLFHYWNFKEWRLWLASFFKQFKGESWGNLLRLSQLLQAHVALQEKGGFYQRRSLWGKIKKEKWQPRLPDWEKLLQQLQ